MPSVTLTLQKQHVLNLLKANQTNKAAGPDIICGRTLKQYVEQLNGVLLQLLLYFKGFNKNIALTI